MSITSNRFTSVTFTGDLNATLENIATENTLSPGISDAIALTTGNNLITLPQVGTITSATIIPPVTNTETITIKGITGDTGIKISPNDPTVIAFDINNLPASFLLVAGDIISPVRIIWA